MAASFIRFSRSAPTKPAVVLAISWRSTSSPNGFWRQWIFKISSRPLTSGLPTPTLRSNRPGRKIAGSKISTRFVAAIMIIPSFTPKPSISTNIWFNVCSRSSCPPPSPEPLRLATASISSINTIQGECFLASANKSRTRAAPTPTNISTKSDPEMLKNGTFASPATAFASNVLPVPGGPTRRTPFGILAPIFINRPGFFKNSTTSSNSSFSSVSPATSLNVTFLPFGLASLARLFPKSIILPPPPPFWRIIITMKNMTTPIGSTTPIRLEIISPLWSIPLILILLARELSAFLISLIAWLTSVTSQLL